MCPNRSFNVPSARLVLGSFSLSHEDGLYSFTRSPSHSSSWDSLSTFRIWLTRDLSVERCSENNFSVYVFVCIWLGHCPHQQEEILRTPAFVLQFKSTLILSTWTFHVGWHHQVNGHEFEQTPGDSEGQGSLACCRPWGHKELDTIEVT